MSKEDEGEVLRRLGELEALVRDLATQLKQNDAVVRMAEVVASLARAGSMATTSSPALVAVPTEEPSVTELEETPKLPPLQNEIEETLRERILTTGDLASAIEQKTSTVSEALRQLRAAKRIANVGTPDLPKWSTIVGDTTSTVQLQELLLRILRQRSAGWSLQALVQVTGARQNRVSGALVELRRMGWPIENLGTPRRAAWFLAPNAKKGPKVAD